MMLVAEISDATWGFFGVTVTAFASIVVALIALLVRQGKATEQISQINRAVNHRPPGAPTLVDRVESVEEKAEKLARETTEHRRWEHQVFESIARHIGFELPNHPLHEEFTHE